MPLISAMTTLRQAFAAALKSLLRGKSFIQAFLAFWVGPAVVKGQKVDTRDPPTRTIEDFLKEAQTLLVGPSEGDGLKDFASKLKLQFRENLLSNPDCMLPSYNYQLPNGYERGQYLALDVGGSTLRVALVELRSRGARGSESGIIRMKSFPIDRTIKDLEGMEFFDWMADLIIETVAEDVKKNSSEKPLPMGLAWSFPIEQTSLKGGVLRNMGKGFLAANGLLGQDLGDVIQLACKGKGLDVELAAIVNDSTAALLSEAYINEATRFSLILGTGVNIAAHLPIPTISPKKYGTRPEGWFDKASHVVVNTELGMFGGGILPMTRWDRILAAEHPRPDFQPLEYLVSGFYLGEMTRIAFVEAIATTGIYGGVVPPALLKQYSLDTRVMSIVEGDTSPSLSRAITAFKQCYPTLPEPTTTDVKALQVIASYVSRRSSSIVAASLFALWQLKTETETEYLRELMTASSPFVAETEAELKLPRTVVSFNGSVIENYPNYLTNTQKYIDALITADGGVPGSIDLVAAKESSLIGAAVALACAVEGKAN
ncbi:hypothetical protein GE09DRAFT_1171693 [Coniochaeta sp. 2T2.1]|nr:hypothetical protein GE09DRAFT_1171693 [Coniochaeta sp. 2T2.1]